MRFLKYVFFFFLIWYLVVMSWVKYDDFFIFIIHRSNCPYETSQWGLAGDFFFFCIVVKKNIYSVLKIIFVWESWLFYLRLLN